MNHDDEQDDSPRNRARDANEARPLLKGAPQSQRRDADAQDADENGDSGAHYARAPKTKFVAHSIQISVVVLNLALGVLFYWFSHDKSLYEKESCGPILGWARFAASLFLIGTLVYGAVVALTVALVNQSVQKLVNVMLAVHIVFYAAMSVLSLFCVVGFTSAYFSQNSCHNLNTLSGVYLTLSWIIIIAIIIFGFYVTYVYLQYGSVDNLLPIDQVFGAGSAQRVLRGGRAEEQNAPDGHANSQASAQRDGRQA